MEILLTSLLLLGLFGLGLSNELKYPKTTVYKIARGGKSTKNSCLE